MLVGLAPISYYRTLNLPAVPDGLTMAALLPMSGHWTRVRWPGRR